MGLWNLVSNQGARASGVVDFGGAGEAGTVITIGGVSYTEADTADAENGIWTNGASAADSATSFAAAVNDDARSKRPQVSAFVSAAGDSVIVVADQPEAAGNLAMTEDSAANVTVENMAGGEDSHRNDMIVVNRVVSAQDVLATEVNIPLSFSPTSFIVDLRTTAGVSPRPAGAPMSVRPNSRCASCEPGKGLGGLRRDQPGMLHPAAIRQRSSGLGPGDAPGHRRLHRTGVGRRRVLCQRSRLQGDQCG
jgi:hypothetical protein